MTTIRSIPFDREAPADPAAETTLAWYTDPTGAFESGFWSDPTPRSAPVVYEENEFCILLAGKVRITDADGGSRLYEAGDAFVIPRGFRGTWETVEPVRKFYATHRPPAP